MNITRDASNAATTLTDLTADGQQAALTAAERLLAGTAEAIGPGTPAPDLMACLTRYRAHLSALTTTTRAATSGTPAVGER